MSTNNLYPRRAKKRGALNGTDVHEEITVHFYSCVFFAFHSEIHGSISPFFSTFLNLLVELYSNEQAIEMHSRDQYTTSVQGDQKEDGLSMELTYTRRLLCISIAAYCTAFLSRCTIVQAPFSLRSSSLPL